MLDLNLPVEKTHEEITKFVRLIETFYCDKVFQTQVKYSELLKKSKVEPRQNALKLDKKKELEEILLNSIM